MESIKELRELLQSGKVNPTGWKRPWGYILLQRGPSIYVTRIALKLHLLPNQITLIGLALGVAGSLLIFIGSPAGLIVGTVLLYFNILADKVDGEVARYRIYKGLGGVYLRGVYLDELNHLVIPSLFFVSLMLGITRSFPYDTSFLEIMSVSAALSIVFIRAWHGIPMQLLVKKYLKHPENFAPLSAKFQADNSQDTRSKSGVLKLIVRTLNRFQDFLLIILLFFAAFIFEIFLPMFQPHLLSGVLLVFFGIVLPFIALENFVKGFFEIERKVQGLEREIKAK